MLLTVQHSFPRLLVTPLTCGRYDEIALYSYSSPGFSEATGTSWAQRLDGLLAAYLRLLPCTLLVRVQLTGLCAACRALLSGRLEVVCSLGLRSGKLPTGHGELVCRPRVPGLQVSDHRLAVTSTWLTSQVGSANCFGNTRTSLYLTPSNVLSFLICCAWPVCLAQTACRYSLPGNYIGKLHGALCV